METKISARSREFLSTPKALENYSTLQEAGVIDHIESLETEIQNYGKLLDGALDIFNQTNISDIMDATVWQISERFLPSYIVFIWKLLQNREDITIKCYKNYKPVEMNLKIKKITGFEPFFQKNPEPVSYRFFASKINNKEKTKNLDAIEPELIIPILGPSSGLYGMVLLGNKIQETDYADDELIFVKRMMSFVSKAIQNHLHYEGTLRDIKTGLYNHSFLLTRLNEEIIKSKRVNSWTSIIIMDVDKFKEYNDSYGHLAGDRVLENLAITIKQGVRAGDVPSRFGGEEFTVLLPNTDKEEAWLVAERLRTMVENMKITWEPSVSQITISLGVITFNNDMNLNAEEVLHQADIALYMSKESGRNCTTVWNAGLFQKIQQNNYINKRQVIK